MAKKLARKSASRCKPDAPRAIPPPHKPPTKPIIGPPEPWPRRMPTRAGKARLRRLRLLDVSDRVCSLEIKVIILAVFLGLVGLVAIIAALK